jgi:hypothetical protein
MLSNEPIHLDDIQTDNLSPHTDVAASFSEEAV